MRPLAISLSPNAEREDVLRAILLLARPWRYKKVKSQKSKVKSLEEEFKKYFDVPHVRSFNSGRSALYVLLKALGIGAGDEVLLQALTCNAVPNPVLWVGAKPVYVDIERDTYNIDPADLERKITPRAKAVVVQHTFGIPADLERIIPIARAHNRFLIEDCAHALGGTYRIRNTRYEIRDTRLGTFGDAAFFSFGRDKVISSVYGGMLITKNADLAQRIEREYQNVPYPSRFWVFQQLLHPIIFAIALPLYNLGIGKFIIWLARKLRLISTAVSEAERRGENPGFFPQRLPEALAALALGQFRRLGEFNEHRRAIAAYYQKELQPFLNLRDRVISGQEEFSGKVQPVWLRFPLQHPRAAEILQAARERGIHLGDWYREVIAPAGTDLAKMGYAKGLCPVAEEVAERVMNLPTYPRLSAKKAQAVMRFLRQSLRA